MKRTIRIDPVVDLPNVPPPAFHPSNGVERASPPALPQVSSSSGQTSPSSCLFTRRKCLCHAIASSTDPAAAAQRFGLSLKPEELMALDDLIADGPCHGGAACCRGCSTTSTTITTTVVTTRTVGPDSAQQAASASRTGTPVPAPITPPPVPPPNADVVTSPVRTRTPLVPRSALAVSASALTPPVSPVLRGLDPAARASDGPPQRSLCTRTCHCCSSRHPRVHHPLLRFTIVLPPSLPTCS